MGQAITYICGSKEAALEAAEKPGSAASAAPAGESIFAGVEVAPADPILGLAVKYREDTDPNKINLGIGAYRTEKGAPWVLPSVRAAEQSLAKDVLAAKLDKEYLPIDGPPDYKKPVQELLFAPSSVSAGRIATVQALSGTGALRVVANFLVENLGTKLVYRSDPTWGNHNAIFQKAGMKVESYPYYKAETRGFDFEGMLAAIEGMEPNACILLHSCAHNPTGVDPTPAQWEKLIAAIKKQNLVPILDNAYQGYASGDLAKDNVSVQMFEKMGMEFFITQSFAKNFGLYGERIGYVHVLCSDKDRAAAVLSQIKLVVRPMYSSPPLHGARLVNRVLTDPKLKAQWLAELKLMSERIVQMRAALRSALEAKGTPGTWRHITDQIGMFSFTGLSTKQVERLMAEFHVYLTKDGRISMAGLNEGNVGLFASHVDKVVRETPADPAPAPKPAPAKRDPGPLRSGSMFKNVAVAPADPILGLAAQFKEDKEPKKINLGIGAYRSNAGVPWVLPSVCTAEESIATDEKLDKEYFPIDGAPAYKKPVQELLFPDEVISSGRIATCQALSGTGALRVVGHFMNLNLGTKTVWMSDPTWGNHKAIFTKSGMTCKEYPYFHPPTKGFDFDGMMKAIAIMAPGDCILLHAVAHNPTGVDPTPAQWEALLAAVKERKLIPLLDNAYQGYASGSLAKDNVSVEILLRLGMEFFITQSFAKNFGLYGERIGYVHVCCSDKDRAAAVLSQLKLVVRPMYSSPPMHGAHLVNRVLSNPKLKQQWLDELTLMSDRIVKMRAAVRSALEAKGTPGKWNHITDQIGMFSYTGLTEPQCERLLKEFHIYLLKSGRISMAGINEGNVQRFAECVDKVVRG